MFRAVLDKDDMTQDRKCHAEPQHTGGSWSLPADCDLSKLSQVVSFARKGRLPPPPTIVSE